MKSILISINPKWCELIASGKKTIEVRKTRPRLETPFKCYIYRTKGTVLHLINNKWTNMSVGGTVIGEFVCNKIDYWQYEWKHDVMHIQDMSRLSCVSVDELLEYANGGRIYGWHISDLVIYDKPRELSEFANGSSRLTFDDSGKMVLSGMKRPPQSWCYVEEVCNGT